MSADEIGFAELLEILHLDDNDQISLNIKRFGQWRCIGIGPPTNAVNRAAADYADRELWFGVHPTSHPGLPGRGGSAEVTRITALIAEIDDAKMSRGAADAVIADIAGVIGWPTAIVESGHGRHFYWPIDRDDAEALSNGAAAALAERFGTLVRKVAASRRGLVDTVSDLARVLRVPGTTNCKADPVPVRGHRDLRGVVLRVADVRAALDAQRIPEVDETEAARDVVCPPADWKFTAAMANAPCAWLATKIKNWPTDEISIERHKWALSQSVKLACAHRRGCLGSEDQYHAAVNALHAAFLHRLAGPPNPRQPDPVDEFDDLIAEGQRRAARKTHAQVLEETGGEHYHDRQRAEAEFMAPYRRERNTMGDNETEGSAPDTAPRRPFVGRDGLRALDLAKAVIASVPIGFNDLNKQFYTYRNGVWTPGSGPIEAKIVELLGNKHRDSHITNTLTVIKHQPQIPRITCDPLPDYINVPNGMVDWKTGVLHDHSPKYLSTVQLPVEYDPDADCPVFEQFISEVLRADCRQPCDGGPGFIWELIGYVLYSGNPHHIAVLLYGKGRNGKGTLIRLLKTLVSTRNMSAVGLHELVENRFRAATLYGKLANLAGDLDARWVDNTAAFKAITGADPVQAEHKFGHPFEFTPWALPFYSANKAFGSADSSEGWTARWVVVPFPNCFLGREDRGLDAKLQTDDELRGILRRSVAALPALMERGRLPVPASVAAAKTAFISASDAVRAWVNEACVIDVDAWTPRTTLYSTYSYRTFFDGSKKLSAREFYNRIEQIGGITAAGRQGIRGFNGIRLKTEADLRPSR